MNRHPVTTEWQRLVQSEALRNHINGKLIGFEHPRRSFWQIFGTAK